MFSLEELEILKLGLSFVPTPKPNTVELEEDLFNFTRKLRLIFHFRDHEKGSNTLISNQSTWTPPLKQNKELDDLIRQLSNIPLYTKQSIDNIMILRPALDQLIARINANEFVIKKADKGSIVVIMDVEYYWTMCNDHLSNDKLYLNLGKNDPTNIVQTRMNQFADKYKQKLTTKEYERLNSNHNKKMANFYMLPKIHKSKIINELIENSNQEYLQVTDLRIEGRPLVAGPIYFTHPLSTILHIILTPALKHVSHIIKDSFDFVNKANINNCIGMKIGVADIRSLYTNISHDLGLKALHFWIIKLNNVLPLLSRFPVNFIMEGMFIVLCFNYFYINFSFYQQLLGTAMGTPAAVVYANLTVAYIESKMFDRLPELYSVDTVDFFMNNYFRFLDDIFFKWKDEFDISALYELFNNADPNIKFLFEELALQQKNLDVKCAVDDNIINFDIYHKPTNSFTYLRFDSCHPKHTLNNISYSLAKRIIQIVTTNKDTNIAKLKVDLINRGHPINIINQSLSNIFSPHDRTSNNEEELITFVHTHNPNHSFQRKKITNCLNNIQDRQLNNVFKNKKVLVTTRNSRNLKQMLTKAKFELRPVLRQPVISGLFPCKDNRCLLHLNGYITSCSSFEFMSKTKKITWTYNRRFTCSSQNVIYMLICPNDTHNYIGHTDTLRLRSNNSKSMVRNADNNDHLYPTHFNNCTNQTDPYFHIFPFFYVDDVKQREFTERRFIKKYKPSLNGKK